MRTKVDLSDIEDIKNSTNKKDFITRGKIHTESFFIPQVSEVVEEPYVDKDGEIKYTIVERKYELNKVTNPVIVDEATDLCRFGFYVISQLRKEFSKIEFEKKYLDDLKAFKIKFPEANKTTFVEDEIIRLNEIKEYLQKCIPGYYRESPEYQKLNSYLCFVRNKITEKTTPKQKKKTSYVWQNNPDKELPDLYSLMIDKYKLIAPGTTYDQFKAIFTGQPIESIEPIKWNQDNASELLYFNQAITNKVNNVWNIYQRLSACFVKPDGEQFDVAWKSLNYNISISLSPDKQRAIDELVNNF